jgi:hypothetical protein
LENTLVHDDRSFEILPHPFLLNHIILFAIEKK